jgi:hypothetical protein
MMQILRAISDRVTNKPKQLIQAQLVQLGNRLCVNCLQQCQTRLALTLSWMNGFAEFLKR